MISPPHEAFFGAHGSSVLADFGNTLRLWDLSTCKRSICLPSRWSPPQPKHTTFSVPKSYGRACIGMSRTGNYVVCCAGHTLADALCIVWSSTSPNSPLTCVPFAHEAHKLAVSEDGSIVCILGYDAGSIVNVEAGEVVAQLRGHSHLDFCFGALSNDKTRLACTDRARIRDVETQTILFELADTVQATSCAFSNKDAFQVAWCGLGEGLVITDSRMGKPHTTICNKKNPEFVSYCAFTPDNKNILCCARDSEMIVLNVETGKEIASLAGDRSGSKDGCSVSPDGTHFLAFASSDRTEVWDANTFELAAYMRCNRNLVAQWFGPQGRPFVPF